LSRAAGRPSRNDRAELRRRARRQILPFDPLVITLHPAERRHPRWDARNAARNASPAPTVSRTETGRASSARAHEFGWNAQLGLALLEEARGRTAQAHLLLARALRDPHWSNRARRGVRLAHFAEIAARAGHTRGAREALSEIDTRPQLVSTSALQALVTRARGELAAAEGNRSQTIDAFQAALLCWRAMEAPLLVAQTRCRLAELLARKATPPRQH
jgi:hypothetical protein